MSESGGVPATNPSLIVESRVRDVLKRNGIDVRMSDGVIQALSLKTEQLLLEAVRKAQAAGRKTIMVGDV